MVTTIEKWPRPGNELSSKATVPQKFIKTFSIYGNDVMKRISLSGRLLLINTGPSKISIVSF